MGFLSALKSAESPPNQPTERQNKNGANAPSILVLPLRAPECGHCRLGETGCDAQRVARSVQRGEPIRIRIGGRHHRCPQSGRCFRKQEGSRAQNRLTHYGRVPVREFHSTPESRAVTRTRFPQCLAGFWSVRLVHVFPSCPSPSPHGSCWRGTCTG